jgi:transcription-repair coupling factor (superfamily II helicase)
LEKIKIKILAQQKGIKTVSNYGQNISIFYENGEKELLKAPAKDDDIILETIMKKLKE